MPQLITCPECKKHLQVPDDLLGKTVQCPECKHTFTAQESTPTAVVSSISTSASRPSAAPSSAAPKKPEWDRDNEEADTRARKSKPPKKKPRIDDDGDEDDDDDFDDERLSRRRRRRAGYGGRGSDYMPHRGGMILAFGIISLVFLPFVFGPMAWFMGNSDMADIRAGRMDPEGEGMVQTGRILGIIGTAIFVLSLFGFLGFCCCLPMMGAAIKPPRG